MNKVKILLGTVLTLIVLGSVIHVPVEYMEIKDATAVLDSIKASGDSFYYILELNFTGTPFMVFLHGKVTWILAGVILAEDIVLKNQGNLMFKSVLFEVPLNTLTQALSASLFHGSYNSTFKITWNYYNTQSYSIKATIQTE